MLNTRKYILLPIYLLLFIFIACDTVDSIDKNLEVDEEDVVTQVKNSTKSDEDSESHSDEDGDHHDVKSIILTDKLNKEVEISDKPMRVVSLSPTATEMIYKAGGTVIARDASSRYPEQIMSLPTVGSAYTPNFESIIALEPDLIVIEALTQARFMGDLSRFDIPIFAVRATSLEDITDGIQSMGIIFDKEEESNQTLIDMNKRIEEISKNFNYSEISLGKSIKDLIDHGIPLEVIERHSEYEPLSEAEALFLLEHLKSSRSYNQETKEKIIGDFEIIRNFMRLNKLRELEQRLI